MNASASPLDPPHLMARAYAAQEVRSQPIALSLIRLVLAQMRDAAAADEAIDSNEPNCWADTLEWLAEQMERNNTDARNALNKAGWLKSDGRPNWNGSVPT